MSAVRVVGTIPANYPVLRTIEYYVVYARESLPTRVCSANNILM